MRNNYSEQHERKLAEKAKSNQRKQARAAKRYYGEDM